MAAQRLVTALRLVTARRLVAVGLAAAALVAVSAAVPTAPQAAAAQGVLWVSGNEFRDPSGCYHGNYLPLVVKNRTNRFAVVYDGTDCRGSVVSTVGPASDQVHEFGMSVRIE
ncbi:hypothetical protein AB0I60_07980 [Actinosynnema sp. NPDC050436]|uniref:hypothetical protein n=1 Tax=Actinosynnema sp. NPDC050436 TaxID=3155659 RepID=UPI0033ED2BF8